MWQQIERLQVSIPVAVGKPGMWIQEWQVVGQADIGRASQP